MTRPMDRRELTILLAETVCHVDNVVYEELLKLALSSKHMTDAELLKIAKDRAPELFAGKD